MKKIYLDHNATTKCSEEVYNEMLPYFKEHFGNPSSVYSLGLDTKEVINAARSKVAKLINAKEDEIIFTSCASEANVTAIMNATKTFPNKKHIITTMIEHASIMETMKYLENNGYEVTYLSVNNLGQIDLLEIENSIRKDTCLIAVMMANNEIGNIYPIKEIACIANEHNIYFHCDAVQAVGKVRIDVKNLGVDTLSIAGHKINAPKGIGVLYVRNDISFTPLIFGHQENNRRGGTENVPYIVGLGKASEMILEDNYQTSGKIKELRDYMEKEIKKNISDVFIYGDMDNRMPNTSSIAFLGVDATKLMMMLESFGIFVSTGSACNSEIAEPSHVLVACGADLEKYQPIRISLGKENTKEEIDIFVRNLINIVNVLRK
ncbi:MAG: cysteine desulfurase [Bacilli bacterium]|nr:cysteine desulfurase [Bacilli bacterium]